MSVQLGVAWSPVAASLPDLDALVDVVEAPGWDFTTALAGWKRVLLHGLDLDVSLADRDSIDDRWEARARAAVERSGTPWLSLHLGFASERVRFAGHMLPCSPPLPRDELVARITASARAAAARLPCPLLLENLDYCPEGAYEHIVEPDVIAEVLEASGCGLLLDLAHLAVTASWLDATPEALLGNLPVECCVEIHVSGPRPLGAADTRLDDVHAELGASELRLLERVLACVTPRVVVLEYRRDAGKLREQLQTLRSLLGGG